MIAVFISKVCLPLNWNVICFFQLDTNAQFGCLYSISVEMYVTAVIIR